jgi:hypothetical protein
MTDSHVENAHLDLGIQIEKLLSDRAHLARIISSMYNWKDKGVEDIIAAFPRETND